MIKIVCTYIVSKLLIPNFQFHFPSLRLYLAFALFCAISLGGCITEEPTAAIGSCTLSLAADVADDAAIQSVLRAEGELVVKQEIEPLMALWAEESSVVDAKHTPQDEADDQLWQGKDALRHRYVRVVFPGAPTSITPRDMQVVLAGDQATVQSTTEIGNEESKAGDRWDMVRQNGCWLIERLTYNLEANP